jgi:hypothetical protein
VTGRATRAASPECCPRSIGITVRNQSEPPSAIAGIRTQPGTKQSSAFLFCTKMVIAVRAKTIVPAALPSNRQSEALAVTEGHTA